MNKPEKEDAEFYELTDMITRKVDLVDRGANQEKRFLVVKRSQKMPDEIVTDANGDLVIVEKVAIPGPVKTAVSRILTEALELIKSAANKAKGGEKPPESFPKDMTKIADLIMSIAEKYPSPKAKADENQKEDTKKQQPKTILKSLTEAMERTLSALNQVKGAETSEEQMDTPLSASLGNEFAAIAKILKNLAEKYPSPQTKADEPKEKDDVEKRGAKLKKERLEKLKSAFKTLQGLLKDLGVELAEDTKGKTKKSEDTPKENEALDKLAKSIESLGEKLSTTIQKQGEEIEQIKKARSAPNSLPVEGSNTQKSLPSWPMDMNKPINRDTVRKEVSFFDVDNGGTK